MHGKDLRPNSIRSSLSEARVAILQDYYKILQDFRTFVPQPDNRMNRSPLGSIMVYKEHFRAGLHFSLYPFIVWLLNLYQVVPAQLTPNSITITYAFMLYVLIFR